MAPTTERVIVGLELQVPYHASRIFQSFLYFVKDYQPTRLVGIGDHLDCPAPSRWNRGTAEEYGSKLQQEVDQLKRMFTQIRAIYDGPWGMHKGNHEQRIDTYAAMKAPAFAGLDCLKVANLLDYDGFGITELPPVSVLTQGWVTTHGDIGTLAKYSGGTALSLARRLRRSVICGHTHRLGHIQETDGGGTLHGVETGHMMDISRASYIRDGCPNWQSGWVTVEINGQRVHPTLVNSSQKGVLTFDG